VDELLLEILLELVGEPVLTVLARALAATLPSRWRNSPRLAATGYWFLGIFFGSLSVWLVPHYMINDPVLRIANLIVSPLMCGFTLAGVGMWRRRRDLQPSVLDGFRYGLLFGFTLQVMRLFGLR
jgi:hypothetical protein